jgi:DNA-binding transcriptional LysR family regulator
MTRKIDWERQVGRHLKLRDLYVFCTVVRCGSMGKAALELGVSQPTVSEAVADLEHTFGVRLLDRSARGVEPTTYGAALLKRTISVFDELKQSNRDIEFLTDPTTGELKIGCSESISATLLPQVIQQFFKRYPRVMLQVDDVPSFALALAVLQDRKYDLVLARLGPLPSDHRPPNDLNVETLFDDQLVVAAGMHTRWARRRKIDLAELVDEPWILMAPNTWNYGGVAEAFQARGLPMPTIKLVTFSVHLRTHLLADGQFITVFPRSLLHSNADYFSLKLLPVDLPTRPWPVAVVTLKNRTLSPVVERFIECAREVAKSNALPPRSR